MNLVQVKGSIDLKGVSKIYRSVSGVEDEKLYDIGVSSSTVFRLESKKLENDIWNISVLVKYPSGNTNHLPVIDDRDPRGAAPDVDHGAVLDAENRRGGGGFIQHVGHVKITGLHNIGNDLGVAFNDARRDGRCRRCIR